MAVESHQPLGLDTPILDGHRGGRQRTYHAGTPYFGSRGTGGFGTDNPGKLCGSMMLWKYIGRKGGATR